MFVVCRALKPRDEFEAHLKFFYPSNPHADDVIAADYVANWDARRPAITPLLESSRARAGKELHHLTAQRVAGQAGHDF